MVNNVYIMHESGLCLFSRAYKEDSQEEDLFSGLLSAFSIFAKSLMGEQIHEIRLEQHRIFYEAKEMIIIVLITPNLRISKRKLTYCLRKICINFLERYQDYIINEILEPQLYSNFESSIDEILFSTGIIKNIPETISRPASTIPSN